MTGRKFVSIVGTAAVAGIAAYASYEHMVSLALAAGQSPSISKMLPFSVDGLVVVASVALVDGRTRKGSAWFAFVLGVAVSIVANVLAAGPTVIDRCVSAWPSVALLVTIEVIARGGKKIERVSTEQTPFVAIEDDKIADLAAVDVAADPPVRHTAKAVTAIDRVARARRQLPLGTVAEIAAKAKVSDTTARRHLKTLGMLTVASPSEPLPAQTNGFHVFADASV